MSERKKKERLDRLLVERGLVESRSKGKTLIMAGEVRVDGEKAITPGMVVPADAEIELISPMPYVSRGGLKLEAALDAFNIKISGKTCADVGACTGGFTDVLLQRGARQLYAIDVGYGQLDWKLRQNRRVVIMERTNARYLKVLPEPIEIVSIDVSFISLKLILPSVQEWVSDQADIVALIKPQFEAGRRYVGKGGIVRDPAVHRQVLIEILTWSINNGLTPKDLIRSPISGSGGNTEFLVWLRPGGGSDLELEEKVRQLTA